MTTKEKQQQDLMAMNFKFSTEGGRKITMKQRVKSNRNNVKDQKWGDSTRSQGKTRLKSCRTHDKQADDVDLVKKCTSI